MTEPKLHFSYLYSQPDVTANADYVDVKTFGESHRLSLGVDLDLLKTDGWILSDGSLIAEAEYSYYLGEERNEESHSKEFGVGVGWKQVLLKRDDDLINVNITPLFRVGRAENVLNFGRGFPVEEESSTNGAFAILAGADICGEYACVTPTVGHSWEKTLDGSPAHSQKGWEFGFALSIPLFKEEKRPPSFPNSEGMLKVFLQEKDEAKREKSKQELLDYLGQKVAELEESDPERAKHYQKVAKDLRVRATLEEIVALVPPLSLAIDHAMARDQIFRIPFSTSFPFGSSEISLSGQWLTVGSPSNFKDYRKDQQAFDCFTNPSLNYFFEMCTKLTSRLAVRQKSGTITGKYRFRVVVKGYANDLKPNEYDKAFNSLYADDYEKYPEAYLEVYGGILKRLAYQRAEAVIDYLLRRDAYFHQGPIYPDLGDDSKTQEGKARQEELKQKGWRIKTKDICTYQQETMDAKGDLIREEVRFMVPFNKNNQNNEFFEIVNATADTDPLGEIHRDFGAKGIDVLSPFYRQAHIHLEIYRNDEPQPLKGADLDEFIITILAPVEGDDASIIVQ